MNKIRILFKCALALSAILFLGSYFDQTVASVNTIESAVQNIQASN